MLALLEIHCCVAIGWDQYADPMHQNLEVSYLSVLFDINLNAIRSQVFDNHFIIIFPKLTSHLFDLCFSNFLQSCSCMYGIGFHHFVIHGNSGNLQVEPTK